MISPIGGDQPQTNVCPAIAYAVGCMGIPQQVIANPARTHVLPQDVHVAIAVLEDYHLLGKQIVRTVLRAAGRAVRDYGRQTVDELVEQVCTDGIDVLLVSTLMLPAALRVRVLTQRLAEVSPNTRVIVGGAPYRFDDQLWRDVGAHAVVLNAGDVVTLVDQLSGAAR